jgi:hypothetical protein
MRRGKPVDHGSAPCQHGCNNTTRLIAFRSEHSSINRDRDSGVRCPVQDLARILLEEKKAVSKIDPPGSMFFLAPCTKEVC